MKSDWRDYALRAAILLAGAAAAATFILQGDPEALPFLALGGALGATLVSGHAGDDSRP
ncbi:MAG TPA: hypothetical protein VLV48_05065 [Thermoanaerobaculia bacterium]|nr:hypothetical protein [Thermoanaerobaculia bacterium]